MTVAKDGARICLYWIPLGAGGSGFVRWNGRVYEALQAGLQRRERLDLYHTALTVDLDGIRFIVETMWPCPDDNLSSRGVTLTGPVFAAEAGRLRTFRYEVRCWEDGVLPDADQAVGGPILVSDDPQLASTVVGLTALVPGLTWGRDDLGLGEMWNSNSVISWLLTMSGVPEDSVRAPRGGRAPGWDAGVRLAQVRLAPLRSGPNDERSPSSERSERWGEYRRRRGGGKSR